jgi:hypothetical protein
MKTLAIAYFIVFARGVIAESASKQCVADNSDQEETCTPTNDSNAVNTGNNNDGEDSEHCLFWAFSGECAINPKYMKEHCSKSCKEHDDPNLNNGLFDLNEDCAAYAKVGECDVNPRYMREFCKKSCNGYDVKKKRTPSMKKHFEEKHQRVTKNHSDKCQLYLAESAIQNSGHGMFTSVPINKGDLVFHPEIVVSYFDNQSNAQRQHLYSQTTQAQWRKVVGNRVDKDDNCGGWAQEGECEANPNYMRNSCAKSCSLQHAGLLTDFDPEKNWLPDNYYWDASNTDSTHEADGADSLVPGIGALANSHTGLVNVLMMRPSVDNSGLHRSKDPGVGAFATHYNLAWKATENMPAGMEIFAGYGDSWFEGREESFGPLPLSHDFEAADRLLQKFWKLVQGKEAFAQDLLTLMKELPERPHLKMAIPSTIKDAKKAKESSSAMMSVPNVIRSEEWLQENGICLDNIRQDQSTILQAGRGAFATRLLPKESVIAPMPMIHMKKERLQIVKETDGNLEIVQDQLILNYCYGHKNSSLVMFPYSPIVNFVNHNFNHTAINAKVQWSESKYHKSYLLDKTVKDILNEPYSGVMLEFVATRDIEEGEEIFINYGDEWEAAWEKHVQEWKPPSDSELPPLYHLNSMEIVKTEEEQKQRPYSPFVMTICFVNTNVMKFKGLSASWSRYSIDADNASVGDSFICKITKRSDGNLYEVVAQDDNYEESKQEVIITDVPRHVIEFMYRPYTSDQHLKHAFRHPLAIPDDVFPSKWLDI